MELVSCDSLDSDSVVVYSLLLLLLLCVELSVGPLFISVVLCALSSLATTLLREILFV